MQIKKLQGELENYAFEIQVRIILFFFFFASLIYTLGTTHKLLK